jgi:hypothetical protein
MFIVDGSTAGSGNLEILVNGGHVTSYVRELGDQCFLASFVPHQATVHTIEVTAVRIYLSLRYDSLLLLFAIKLLTSMCNKSLLNYIVLFYFYLLQMKFNGETVRGT